MEKAVKKFGKNVKKPLNEGTIQRDREVTLSSRPTKEGEKGNK